MDKAIAVVMTSAVSAPMLWFWLRGVYAMFKAAANRAPGCGFFEATSGLSLLFNNDNYTEEGRKWTRVYRRCLAGFLLIPAGTVLLMILVRQLVSP
jgi:hypothetical protein